MVRQLEIKNRQLEEKVIRLESKVQQLESSLEALQENIKSVNPLTGRSSIQRTCREAHLADPSLDSGMHWIDPDGQGVGDDPIYVYCEDVQRSPSGGPISRFRHALDRSGRTRRWG
jgi:hypothetical protein